MQTSIHHAGLAMKYKHALKSELWLKIVSLTYHKVSLVPSPINERSVGQLQGNDGLGRIRNRHRCSAPERLLLAKSNNRIQG